MHSHHDASHPIMMPHISVCAHTWYSSRCGRGFYVHPGGTESALRQPLAIATRLVQAAFAGASSSSELSFEVHKGQDGWGMHGMIQCTWHDTWHDAIGHIGLLKPSAKVFCYSPPLSLCAWCAGVSQMDCGDAAVSGGVAERV